MHHVEYYRGDTLAGVAAYRTKADAQQGMREMVRDEAQDRRRSRLARMYPYTYKLAPCENPDNCIACDDFKEREQRNESGG